MVEMVLLLNPVLALLALRLVLRPAPLPALRPAEALLLVLLLALPALVAQH